MDFDEELARLTRKLARAAETRIALGGHPDLREVRSQVAETLTFGAGPDDRFGGVQLVIDELVGNAYRHATAVRELHVARTGEKPARRNHRPRSGCHTGTRRAPRLQTVRTPAGGPVVPRMGRSDRPRRKGGLGTGGDPSLPGRAVTRDFRLRGRAGRRHDPGVNQAVAATGGTPPLVASPASGPPVTRRQTTVAAHCRIPRRATKYSRSGSRR